MLHNNDDDFGSEVESKMASSSSSSSSSSSTSGHAANRQRALQEQKQRVLQKQQMRRGSAGTAQANRGFTGAARKIPTTKAGSSFRNFSAPKAIDPLEGDDDGLQEPMKKTGYADNFRGSSRNPNGGYGGVYEAMQRPHSGESQQYEDGPSRGASSSRVANVADEAQQHPNQITVESKYDEDTKSTAESKSSGKAQTRMIPSTFDPEEAERKPPSTKSRSSASKKKEASKAKKAAESSKIVSKQPALDYDGENNDDDEETEDVNDDATEAEAPAARQRGTRRKQKQQKQLKQQKEKQRMKQEKHQQQMQQRQQQRDDDDDDDDVDDEDDAEEAAVDDDSASDAEEVPVVIAPRPSKGKRGASSKGSNNKKSGGRASPSESKQADQPNDGEDGNGTGEDGAEQYDRIPRALHEDVFEAPDMDMSDMRAFLMRPLPKGYGTVQCYIERNKAGANKLYPEYQLYLKDGDRFLMSAKKRSKNRTTNYAISMDPKDYDRNSVNCLGKLRANFIGTEFQIFDRGVNPKNADPDSLQVGTAPVRQELGAIVYASNVLGSRGPRKMKVAIPAVSERGERKVSRPQRKSDELLTRFKERDMDDIVELINKPPRWNDHVAAYVLNFNGRVTMASVKNFQLVSPLDDDEVKMTYGRCARDVFSHDAAYPLSIFQAFCIAISSTGSKLGCE